MKTIFVLVGLPFSGKTTMAQTLVTPNTLLIERDRYLEDVSRDPVTVARLRREAELITQPVSRYFRRRSDNAYNDALTLEYVRRVERAIQTTQAECIIVDGTHLQRLSRMLVRVFPEIPSVAIVLQAKVETCIERMAQAPPVSGVRSTVTPEMIRRMAGIYEAPTIEEGFLEIRFV